MAGLGRRSGRDALQGDLFSGRHIGFDVDLGQDSPIHPIGGHQDHRLRGRSLPTVLPRGLELHHRDIAVEAPLISSSPQTFLPQSKIPSMVPETDRLCVDISIENQSPASDPSATMLQYGLNDGEC